MRLPIAGYVERCRGFTVQAADARRNVPSMKLPAPDRLRGRMEWNPEKLRAAV